MVPGHSQHSNMSLNQSVFTLWSESRILEVIIFQLEHESMMRRFRVWPQGSGCWKGCPVSATVTPDN